MADVEKLKVYERILEGCAATFADVPRQWQEWSSMSVLERQDYMLYQVDNAVRNVADIELDAGTADLGAEVMGKLDAAKRQWEEVKPVLEQMERSFGGSEVKKGEAA